MAQLLLSENCTVTMAQSRTRNLSSVVLQGDFVIAAIGRPEMIKGHWLKDGATAIDVGINRIIASEGQKTKLVGDVATKEALGHVKAITLAPRQRWTYDAVLLRNTLVAARIRMRITPPRL